MDIISHYRQSKRPCPRCGSACRAVKSTTVSSSHKSAIRLQNIRCTECGIKGTVTVTESVDWPNLAIRGQL